MKKKYPNHAAYGRFTRKRTHSIAGEHEAEEEETHHEQEQTEVSPDHAKDTQHVFHQQDSEATHLVTTECSGDDKTADKPIHISEQNMSDVSESRTYMTLPTVVCAESVDESAKIGSNLPNISGVFSTGSHQHDVNNNSTGFEESQEHKHHTGRERFEIIVVDETSRQAFGSGVRNQHVCPVEMKGLHEADRESSMDNDDSMCSASAGDTVVRTNLYGTDTDSSYKEGYPAESMTPTNQPGNVENVQQDVNGSYRHRNMSQSRQPHQILQDEPAHYHQYQTQELVQHYPDQHCREQQYVGRDETNMSISNQPTSDNTHYKEGEKLTSFGGIFKQTNSELADTNNDNKASIMGQQYSGQSYGHLAMQEDSGHQQYLSSTSYTAAHSSQTVPSSMDDCHMAAEQLASELVKTYGGSNSHMISDMLKREGDQQFVCDGFERQSQEELSQYADCSQPELHDVDLLNTPQQLPVEDVLYQHQARAYGQTGPPLSKPVPFGSPQACSTPDGFRKNLDTLHTPQNFRGSLTYNDIQLHGSKWSTCKDSTRHDQRPDYERSENPCPEPRLHSRHPQMYQNSDHCSDPQSPDIGRLCTNAMGNYSAPKATPNSPYELNHINTGQQNQYRKAFSPQAEHMSFYGQGNSGMFSAVRSPTVLQGGSDYQRQAPGEITKMTFTPREMMETHLSQTYQYQRQNATATRQTMSEMDYSSIYPRREFIEKTAGPKLPSSQSVSQRGGSYDHNPPPKKRHRMSKYSSPLVPQDAPPMPIIDDMMAKYPPSFPRDLDTSRHKYFVVNPSDATSMTSKTLLCKYIDFLILENEQITEISKSISPPVDIYVTEDMYFMDSLIYRVPFPSKKFTEWVGSFYPKLNFWEMQFKGSKPSVPSDNLLKMVDNRQTQQILEDTFYFFQREVMNSEA